MYELKSSFRFEYNRKCMSCSFWEYFQYEYSNNEYLFVNITPTMFGFRLALTLDFFITYICVRGINNVLFMPAWNIHDFGLRNIDCHYWCVPSSRATGGIYVGFADKDGGGHQGVVTFGFEYGWTKADVFDAWSLTGNIGSCLTCDMRTLLVISTTSECKQNAVSAVGVPSTRSAHAVRAPCNSMHAVEAPWERRESAMRAQAIVN